MGCDIHMMTEVRGPNGKWTTVSWKEPCWICNGAGVYGETHREEIRGQPCNWCKGEGKERVTGYNHRNYNLFAILADVRNGRGFAGCKIAERFTPIADPRGVPKDASAQYAKSAEEWGQDGHSHSWLTLAELEAYGWQDQSTIVGVIPVAKSKHPFGKETIYDEFVAGGRQQPTSWCGDVGGGDNIVLEERDFMRLRGSGALPLGTLHVRVSWKQTCRESVGEDFFTNTMEALRALATEHGGADNVRIVFFFDN